MTSALTPRDHVADVLLRVLSEQPVLAARPLQLGGLLRDLVADAEREVFLLVSPLEEGLADLLEKATKETLGSVAISLQDRLHFSAEAALWCVATWAYARRTLSPPEYRAVLKPSPPPGGKSAVEVIVDIDGKGAYDTMTAAIETARAGQRIVVRPGIYREVLVVRSDLELVALGATGDVVVEGLNGPCLRVEGGDVTVQGVQFRGRARRVGMEAYGVEVAGGRLALEDCSVTANTLASMAVAAQAQATLRKCAVKGGAAEGVLVSGGQATLESCSVSGHARACVVARDHAEVTLTDCQLRSGREVALFAHDGGKLHAKSSELSAHALAAACASSGGSLRLEGCVVTRGKAVGLLVDAGGMAEVDGGEFTGHPKPHVLVQSGGEATLVGVRLANGQACGVLATKGGVCRLERCEVVENQHAGLVVGESGRLTAEKCSIRNNGYVALAAFRAGRATVRDCDLRGNKQGVWDIEPGSKLEAGSNKEG